MRGIKVRVRRSEKSLNPCFYGLLSVSWVEADLEIKAECLNPCFYGLLSVSPGKRKTKQQTKRS